MNNVMLKKIFTPKPIYLIGMILVTTGLLIYTLGVETAHGFLAYFTYAFSTYTLIVTCMALPRLIRYIKSLMSRDRIPVVRRVKATAYKHPTTKRYFTDKNFRAGVSLYAGFALNIVYALIKTGSGIWFRSSWMISIGIYYAAIGLIRFYLLRRYRQNAEGGAHVLAGYRTYRFTGVLILFLSITIAGIMVQMIIHNEHYSYPGILIFLSALYAFYYFISAIVNMVKFSKNDNPILSAAKNVTFAAAAMSLLALQTALLSTFGNGDVAYSRLMNSIVGTAIFTFIIGLAIYMIGKGSMQIGKIVEKR